MGAPMGPEVVNGILNDFMANHSSAYAKENFQKALLGSCENLAPRIPGETKITPRI